MACELRTLMNLTALVARKYNESLNAYIFIYNFTLCLNTVQCLGYLQFYTFYTNKKTYLWIVLQLPRRFVVRSLFFFTIFPLNSLF